MHFLIPTLMLMVGLAAGMGAGLLVRDASETEAAGTVTEEAADPAGGVEATPGTAGGSLVLPASDATEYVRLRNQFIVPVVRDGAMQSLVVLALTVEIGTGGSDVVFQHEPRLRDSFLRVLFAHANIGGFDGQFTEAAMMAPLRSGLRDAAIEVLGDSVRDVLIVDITRQDA